MADSKRKEDLDLASLLIHADIFDDEVIPVGVPISTTTTFRHNRLAAGEEDPAFDAANPSRHVYSRYTQPVLSRAEKVLSALLKAQALAFSSGLSAIYAALLHYQPEVIAISEGYHGSHETIAIYTRTRENVKIIDLDDDYSQYESKRFVCWLETPVNPYGTCRDIEHYAKKTHALKQGKLAIDSTFGPPPLQDPFQFGADLVMHSGTKYFAGHSDALIGVLATKDKDEWDKLWSIRTYSGMVPGSLEAWLLLRSLRTVQLRVTRQSATATAFALWLNEVATNAPELGSSYDGCPGGIIKQVWHAVFQGTDGVGGGGFNPLGGSAVGTEENAKRPQMTSGPACFSLMTTKQEYASGLPYELHLMVPATSLGGVESLIEQRSRSDPHADPRLLRLSIGLEDLEDMKADWRRALAIVSGKTQDKGNL